MKVTVNKCRFTGQLFENDKEYANHLQRIRRQHKAAREAGAIKNDFASWLAAEKDKLRSPSELCSWLLENQVFLMKSCNALGVHSWSSDKFYPETDKFTKIEFERVPDFQPNLSNSHSCPKGGVHNWCGKTPGAPTGYPGWGGYVRGTLTRAKKHMSSYPYSAIFNLVDIHTGTGGGGNEHWGYDVKIFAADWPTLGEEETYKRLMAAK